MNKLPDDSGFFVGEVYSKRPPGLWGWIICKPNGSVRSFIFFYRMVRDAYYISRLPDLGPPMSLWRCLRYAWNVTFRP